jgi:hypothetical protein
VPDGLVLAHLDYNRPEGGQQYNEEAGDYVLVRATLYGDPRLADTLDGPVLLVGTSSGSARNGPPYDVPGERAVDLGGRPGRVIPDTDRTWVVIDGNDYLEFVVGRGIGEDELIAAALGADFASAIPTLAPDDVPAGLQPLVAGSPPDGVWSGVGTYIDLRGGESTSGTVSAVRADPRLAALWGFWIEDPAGTLVRGRPGSAGVLQDRGPTFSSARARVWAEDGMVLSVVLHGAGDEVVDQVVANLRVGTVSEFEVMRREIAERPPTREEAPTFSPDSGFVSGVEGVDRWSFELYPNPNPGIGDWSAAYFNLTSLGGGGGSVLPPPLGEVAVYVGGSIVGGAAPPGTTRVTVTGPDGSTREAVLSEVGPRPGERVWGTFLPDIPPPTTSSTPPYVFWSITVTAYDAAGVVLDSVPV